EGRPLTRDKREIRPWASTTCAPAALRGGASSVIAKRDQSPHVQVVHRLGDPGVYDCGRGIAPMPGRGNDSLPKPARGKGQVRRGMGSRCLTAALVAIVAVVVRVGLWHLRRTTARGKSPPERLASSTPGRPRPLTAFWARRSGRSPTELS